MQYLKKAEPYLEKAKPYAYQAGALGAKAGVWAFTGLAYAGNLLVVCSRSVAEQCDKWNHQLEVKPAQTVAPTIATSMDPNNTASSRGLRKRKPSVVDDTETTPPTPTSAAQPVQP